MQGPMPSALMRKSECNPPTPTFPGPIMTSRPPRKKQRLLRQADIRPVPHSHPPTTQRPQYIDIARYPDIVQQIISYLPLPSLLSLRLTARALRNHVDFVLNDHLVLKPGNQLDGITGPLPALLTVNSDEVLGRNRSSCHCRICRSYDRRSTHATLRDARVLDLRYLTALNLRVLKNCLARVAPVPVIRLWMWCTAPQPEPLPIPALTLVVFGWAGMWEPSNGFRRERFNGPPLGIRKAVFNLNVSCTKVPFIFHGMFVKRTPPASLEKVVIVFHSNWASDDRPCALKPLQEAIPRIVQLLTESRRRRPQIVFVNSDAILPGTFPLGKGTSKRPDLAECASFVEYVTTFYISARGRAEFEEKVSFLTREEYQVEVGPEAFRVETLG
ncbi:hypothetical protein CC85DRAFT_326243 [Cutaneotrichosporon oleaginosum]|uniref:F-box domain-containing protein n=1 Tax=Cutaneotrichosporon oleaginosum TaxID=879819 RepID=A0A0J1B9Y2_9TREE|nr:uncharacterized protein CC85DRAFT_326243 [Cutaneotrichosporon oleaginosum]KLT44659.1 hypothetical protein CC85DRAFT_326243 [Cutaneotrichosporon oleaginosum]TXT07646.1 hypothetical protein COLE_04570 [Cutaneotrichosporon oleaginosum]